MRVVQTFEDGDLRSQVVFEFLVEFGQVDRLDGNDALSARMSLDINQLGMARVFRETNEDLQCGWLCTQ